MAFKLKKIVLKISKGLEYILLATNLLAIILLVISIQAPSIAPSYSLFVAYMGMGFPFLFIWNIAFLLLWIVFFRWKYIIIQLIVLGICFNTFSTYVAMGTRTPDVPENAIKFMSYNVRGFDWLTGDAARENPVFTYMAESGADIICMQEFAVDEKKDSHGIISLEELDEIMDQYPYRSIVRLGNTEENCMYGLACYSKFPIRKVARIPIESAFNGSAMYEIRINKKDVLIVNNHLESNRITAEDKELYKELVINKGRDRKTVIKFADTVKERLEPAFKTREQQADIIASYVKHQRQETGNVIICGDFNDTPVSYAYETIKADLIDAFKMTGRGLGITYHENMFWFRIDYIMHTLNIKSYNCVVDKVKYSDHYPITAYLSIKGL